MRGKLWQQITFLLLVTSGAVHAQQPSASTSKDVFAEDARLLRQVKIQAAGISVKELLARLSQQTGVTLVADKITGEDKLIAFSPARPLRDTLADVAALFNDAWQRDKTREGSPRYVLTRTRRAMEQEQALQEQARNRLITQLDAQVKALDETEEQLWRRPPHDPIRENLSDKPKRLATQVYAALTPDQRQTLFARRFLNFTPNAISPQLRTPLTKLYEQSIQFISRFRQPDEANPPEAVEDYARRGVQLAIHSCGGQVLPAVQVYGKGSMNATLFAELDARKQWVLPPHGNPYGRTPPASKKTLPSVLQTQQAGQEKRWSDRMRKLAEATNAPVFADFYRSQPVNAMHGGANPDADDQAQPNNTTALDALCLPVGYLWWTRPGGTLLFRKRDWYEQRLYEVPEDWLQETVKRLAAQNRIPALADFLRARQLTTQQILGLNSLQTGEGYSYSEVETAGAAEMLAFLDRQLATNPIYRQPMKLGRVQNDLYHAEGEQLAGLRDSLQEFFAAQSRPLSLADLKLFRVDVYNSDRGAGPEGGYQDVELGLMWNLGDGVSEQYHIRLPLTLPDDHHEDIVIQTD